MIKTLISLLLGICTIMTFGQPKVEFKIQLLTPDLISDVILNKDSMIEWTKFANHQIEEYLKKDTGSKDIRVQVSFHTNKPATIEISSRPVIDKSSLAELSQKINQHKSPNTRITDFSFAITASLNGGCSNKEMEFKPAIALPMEQRLSEFKLLDLESKKISIQSWVIHEVIPVLAFYENKVESKFAGVRNIGAILQKEKYIHADIDQLTFKNSDYWRATMEMGKGNQLIPFSKICMDIANGDFDKANRLFYVINLFSDKSTLPAIYQEEMNSKLEMLENDLSVEIKKGIALHDKGNYEKAISQYENLLKICPRSAWLNYELYFSKSLKINDPVKSDNEWEKVKVIIYQCDPLYSIDARIKNGREGYLMSRRKEINNLFQSKVKFKKDFLNYADIALDLGDYGLAAQMYWQILSFFSKDDVNGRNVLAYYLYCLDKLGDKITIKSLKGDFKNDFKNIEQERKKLMETSPYYNAFKENE